MQGIRLVIAAASLLATAPLFKSAGQQEPSRPAEDNEFFTEQVFQADCASCHGPGGAGGDRAPALTDNPDLRKLNESDVEQVIKQGTLRGMPAFASLPSDDVTRLAQWIHSMNKSALENAPPEQVIAGESFFFGEGGCSHCHMVHGRGVSDGPDLSNIAARSTASEIEKVLDNPTSQIGIRSLAICPPWAFCPDFSWAVVDVTLNDGTKLRGFERKLTEHELILQTFDHRIRLLDASEYTYIVREKQSFMPRLKASAKQRRDLLAYLSSLGGIEEGPIRRPTSPVTQADIERIMSPSKGEWTTYNGALSGNRYSPLDQINVGNVRQLQPQFIFSPGGSGLEGTPLVMDGIMYVTGDPQICAINARTGTPIWCTPRTNGLGTGLSSRSHDSGRQTPKGPNRGVAILGERLFYVSDDAYLVCLNRLTGATMWSRRLPEPNAPGKYYNSSAPMVVGDLVISGVAGGDSPVRGFLAAYNASSGDLAWRFYTIPKPGEHPAETWIGNALPTGGGATWATGSYDTETNTLYWAVGNPYPDTDPNERKGSNLYTNCVVALDPATGKRKWYFQFTPGDTHDWDATEPLLLVDANWRGQPRKLLVTAQRSGIFYVLDRTSGQFLLAKPFVKKMTWARGFNADGSPVLVAGQTPTIEGTKTCPAVRGATNWYATAFDPHTELFYVNAVEDCGIYRTRGRLWAGNPDPSDVGARYIRALHIETGDIAWEKRLTGPQETNYSGVLATAGGLVFHGETGGDFAAVDSRTGKTLWTFRCNDSWRASPMTYMVDGRQYIAAVVGSNLISFAIGYE